MSHRVVEVSNPSYLTTDLKHLVVQREGQEVGRVPLEDLGVLVLDSWGIVVTLELQVKLAEANIAVVVCDAKHMPTGMLVGFEGHHQHAKVIRDQIRVAEPTKKRLWQAIIQAKIRNQAESLLRSGNPTAKRDAHQLAGLATLVRSGDPDNLEGQAARMYWQMLFGGEFLRDRDEPGINACLNYGYAIIRAAVTRALVGTGLHPALGIHHRNLYNAFALADDVMEPLRPMVDLHVFQFLSECADAEEPFAPELTPAIKRRLLEILLIRLDLARKTTGIMIGIPQYAAYFKQALCRERTKLIVPAFGTGADTESCG